MTCRKLFEVYIILWSDFYSVLNTFVIGTDKFSAPVIFVKVGRMFINSFALDGTQVGGGAHVR